MTSFELSYSYFIHHGEIEMENLQRKKQDLESFMVIITYNQKQKKTISACSLFLISSLIILVILDTALVNELDVLKWDGMNNIDVYVETSFLK